VTLRSRARLAGTTIAVDLDPQKLERAKDFGERTVNASETDPVEAICTLTDGNGADVHRAVGRPEVMQQAPFAISRHRAGRRPQA
jgi:S-(hydroxymethyl)mycothiol dehydrogenase